MRLYSYSLVVLRMSVASTTAFVPQATTQVRTLHLAATTPRNENSVANALESVDSNIKGAFNGLALAAALWVAPTAMAPMVSYLPASENSIVAASVANAKEMASGTGTRVNKDPESLLRYGLPINNKEVCALFDSCRLLPILVVNNLTRTTNIFSPPSGSTAAKEYRRYPNQHLIQT